MPLVNEADKVFIETRYAIIGPDPPENLEARIQLSQGFSQREHHKFALAGWHRSFEMYMEKARIAWANNAPDQEFQNLAFQSFFVFLYWYFRSKGSGFVDILNLERSVTQNLENAKSEPEPDSASITVDLEGKLKSASVLAPELISPPNNVMATKKQIDETVQSLSNGVVIVDYMDLRYASTTSFVAMVYRKWQMNLPRKIPHMTMTKIDKWVKDNLDTGRQGQTGRVSDRNALDSLAELSGLLESLIQTLPKLAIQPHETVIFCPTRSLNRVLIHAISLNGKPFIERNPVVYSQSLTILHGLWLKFQNRQKITPLFKAAVINPMREFWSDGRPVQSSQKVADLARKLDADFHHGFNLQSNLIAKAVEGSTVLFHHGHVSYNPEIAIDSALILNKKKAFKAAKRIVKPIGCAFLIAQDFYKIKLDELAVAIIIGCGSGVTAIFNTDDMLGIPTTLFYSSASAVVSTLWSIDDEDSCEVSQHFFAEIWQ